MIRPLWIFIMLAVMAVQGYSGLFFGNLPREPETAEQKILLSGGESLDLEEVLRFHVVAHSDEARDQEVKEQVTREVLAFVGDRLQDTGSRELARQALLEEIPLVQERVEQVLQAEGTPHPVKVSLQREMFPPRQYLYGDFPAGEYEALRIVIGSGAGENWWCVLFPPLCFTHAPEKKSRDHSYGESETISDMGCAGDSVSANPVSHNSKEKQAPSPGESCSEEAAEKSHNEVEVRFRVVEWVSSFLPSYYGSGRSN